MKEREIIELITNGDELGLKELQINYSPLIRYIISPILKDTREQEECLSEVIMKIWDKISFYDSEKGSWNAWVTSIARNTALNRLRKIKPELSFEDLPSDVSSSEPTPEEILIKREREQLLIKALGKLSQNDRAIFYRKYYYLQPTSQIASELSMTERAVEGKLYRIKQKLRKLLGGDDYE